MADLEPALRSRLDAGGRAFVPYVTGGLDGVDAELLRGLEEAGADAIEVGIPFSDPVMDGAVIQEASRRALEDGATPSSVLGTIKEAGLEVPVAVMTYANPVWHRGSRGVPRRVRRRRRVTGVIVPDLPVDEAARLDRRVPASLGGPGVPRGARAPRTTGCARSATRRGGSSTASRPTGSRARGTGWPRRPPSSWGGSGRSTDPPAAGGGRDRRAVARRRGVRVRRRRRGGERARPPVARRRHGYRPRARPRVPGGDPA